MNAVVRPRRPLRRVTTGCALVLALVAAVLLMHAPLAAPADAGPAVAHHLGDGAHPTHGPAEATIASCAMCGDPGDRHALGVDCLLMLVFGAFALVLARAAGHAGRRGGIFRSFVRLAAPSPAVRPPPSLWELSISRT